MQYTHVLGYKFTKLTNLEFLQEALTSACKELGLKGTIVLSIEGLNVFLSGHDSAINAFCALAQTLHLPTIDFKRSYSDSPAFDKMMVKIKEEIIPLGDPSISPSTHPAPNLSPETFQEWQNQHKAMIILDTRNDYEVRLGTFKNAIHLNISHFRQFKDAVNKLPETMKSLPVVTFCTGGIRCEKAAPFLMAQGFNEVYQLEGGILRYFEHCQDEHFEGDCFMFDKRGAIDASLSVVPTTPCTLCNQPLTHRALAPHSTTEFTCELCTKKSVA